MKQHALGTWERPTPESSFRLRLSAELAARCGRNSSYSLRAFARDLDTDGSSLSQLLRGKRKLTGPTIERFGAKLGLAPEAIAAYAANEARWGAGDELADDEAERLARDAASVLAEWEHAALLELVHLEGFVPDSRWIARVLDLDVDTVNIVLQRLLRLRLLELSSEGRWIDRCGDMRTRGGEPSPALIATLVARLQAGLARARPESVRATSLTLALPSARLPELEARLARLARDLAELERTDEPRDALFRVELQFFPVLRHERA